MKKTLVILLSAALCLTVLNGCAKKRENAALADVPKKVTVGTQPSVYPHTIAIAEGWLTEAMGTEVDVVAFDAGRDIIAAMAAGSIDFGVLGSPPAALGIANGIPYKVIFIQDVLGDIDALVVRESLGVQDARGLAGLKIATVFSSTSHYSLMKYLEISNVNSSSVNIIDMMAAEIAGAFLRGDIDGAYIWDPHLTQMKNNGGVMLTSSRELANRGYPTMDVEIVRTEFADRYPELVRAYTRTMDRAVALYRNDPKAAGAVMARYLGMTAEECLSQVEGAVWLSVIEQKSMRWAGSSALGNSIYTTAKFLYEQGIIAQEPSIEVFQNAVTGQYLDLWLGK